MCLLWILLQIGCYNPTLPSPLKPENELRSILFIGNSHTYYNGGVDQELLGLIRASEHSGFEEADRIALGGFTLANHFKNAETLRRLESRPWDLVVLQENTYEAYLHPEDLDDHIEPFFFKMFNSGAQFAFFMTWAYRDSSQMYPVLYDAYTRSSVTYYGQTIPVGEAWQAYHSGTSQVNLYDEDGVHPNPAGTFYTALLFYSYLFRENPESSGYVPETIDVELANQLKIRAWNFYLDHL